ncbi:MAG: GNAT family N-acetyltransferase [Bdellovibrionota bacterium]
MAFDSFSSKRLVVRRLLPEDAETISFYRSLPEVSKFQSWEQYSTQKASDLISEMKTSDPSVAGKWFQFGISLKATGELIGDIGFLNTDEHQKSWIGFTLSSTHWGNGYAIEAVEAVLSYYSSLEISKIWASTDPQNHSSAKLLKKLGFSLLESKPEDHIYFKDAPR